MSFPLPNRGSPLAYCKRTFTILRMWLQTTPTGCEGSQLQNKTHGGVSMISTHKIPYHIDLLLGFASLRSTSFNSFAFPVEMMPSTLLDVMNALGLLSSSEELFLFAHTFPSELRNLDIHSDKQVSAYKTFLNTHASIIGPITDNNLAQRFHVVLVVSLCKYLQKLMSILIYVNFK